MKTNLRDIRVEIPDKLKKALKTMAVERDMTLRALVIEVLERAVQDRQGVGK